MNWQREFNRRTTQSKQAKKKFQTPRQKRREDQGIYGKFIMRITDKWWWNSLKDKEKEEVCDSYYHSESMWEKCNAGTHFTSWGNYEDEVFMAVGADEEFLEWENTIKEIVGDLSIARDNKLRSLGV